MKKQQVTEDLYKEITEANSDKAYQILRTGIVKIIRDCFGCYDENYLEDTVSDIVIYLLERSKTYDNTKCKFSTFVYSTVKFKFIRAYLHNKVHAAAKFGNLYSQGKFMDIKSPHSLDAYICADSNTSVEDMFPSLSCTSALSYKDCYNIDKSDFDSLKPKSKEWINKIISGEKKYKGRIPKDVLKDTKAKLTFEEIY